MGLAAFNRARRMKAALEAEESALTVSTEEITEEPVAALEAEESPQGQRGRVAKQKDGD